MKVYRCCREEEYQAYLRGEKYLPFIEDGTNTFRYDGREYIHFFLFPEVMELLMRKGFLYWYCIECEMPFEKIRKYYGYGYYSSLIPGYYAPFPEFAIPLEEFDDSCITDFSEKVKEEWKRPSDFEQYKNNIPQNCMADWELGQFPEGYNQYSILQYPIESLIGHMIPTKQK